MELLKERISHAENEEERRHLSDEWEQARMGREEQMQVENMLLTDDAGLLRRLYNEAPDATETERMMFLLLRLGLSRADVSRLMAHDQSSLSSISNRMFRRVKGHGPMNSAEAYNWLLEI